MVMPTAVMQLIFTKGTGKHDRMEMVRVDGTVERIDCPKQGIIPHDMVHFAVESTLKRRGFISRVLEGAASNYQMESEPESDAVERLVEVFQADGWSGWNSRPEDMLDLYQTTCRARDCGPLKLTEDDIEAVRLRMLDLTEQWQAISAGNALRLEMGP